jgi:hypothetical protein
MEKHILIIDDKASKIAVLRKSGNLFEKDEGDNLQHILYGVMNNNFIPKIIDNFSDMDDLKREITEFENLEGIVLDLNLNSIDGIDSSDKEIIIFILKTIMAKYEKFFIIVFSAVADQWADLKSELGDDDPDLAVVLNSPYVKVIEKGQNIETVFYNEIQSLSKLKNNEDSFKLLMESKTTLIKEYNTEWALISIFLSIINWASIGFFPSFIYQIVIQLCILALFIKVISIEKNRHITLMKLQNKKL